MPAEPATETSRQSYRRCTVPDRWRSFRFALLGVLLAVGFLAYPLLVVPAGWERYLFYACFLLAAAFALLALVATVVPHKFIIEIALTEEGFKYRMPLRQSLFVRFADIRRIEAVSRGDGDWGDEVPWRIYSRSGKMTVSEPVLHLSGLSKALTSRLSLDRAALSASQKHQPRGLDLLFGRKFIIYEDNHA